MKFKRTFLALSTVAALALTNCGGGGGSSSNDTNTTNNTSTTNTTNTQKETRNKAVLGAYADLAIAKYNEALSDAKALQSAIKAFTDNPTAETLAAAKEAWLKARESYGPTEIFRLSNGPIDAEEGFAASFGAPEGQLNAWPLDENMIDYTIDAEGNKTTGNIIDTKGSFTPTGTDATAVDATTITKTTIAALNENGGDANVATGYHAIEFLLWGQDQDYASFVADNITHGPLTAGQRPLTDYTEDANAQRRKDYLNAAAELIVDDLQKVVDAWTTGGYKEALIGEGNNAIDSTTALKDIFAGMGLFIKSELANERIAVALNTPSEEDEHSCFSDNTHRDIVLNYEGFKNALALFSTNLSSELQTSLKSQTDSIDTKVALIDSTAKNERHFDYQIQPNSTDYSNIKNAKNEMRALGDDMVKVASEYGISLTETDVTDSEESETTDQ
jgi:putative iron-regulated protein